MTKRNPFSRQAPRRRHIALSLDPCNATKFTLNRFFAAPRDNPVPSRKTMNALLRVRRKKFRGAAAAARHTLNPKPSGNVVYQW